MILRFFFAFNVSISHAVIRRGDNDLYKKLRQLVRRRFVHLSIKGDHAAESGDRVTHQRFFIRFNQKIGAGHTARVGMFNNRAGRIAKLGNKFVCGGHIDNVVV